MWNLLHSLVNAHFHSGVRLCGTDGAKIVGHSAYIGGNGHIVIIQDNDKVRLQLRCVIKGFICHSAGKGSVSDHRNHMVFPTQNIPGSHIAEACGNGI